MSTTVDAIRVASVPASHVYVRHLAGHDGGTAVQRLPDPIPADGAKVPGGWWPPLMLDSGWVSRHYDEFDVFHVHFGFDAIEPQQLADVTEELRRHGKPFVYTVHDLRNPHHPVSAAHDAALDVMIGAATELVTLTEGAADAIKRRWGRSATVLPHPHVVERERMRYERPQSETFRVGVHVKSLRANMDPLPLIPVLADVIRELPDAVLQINVHDEIFQPDNHWYAPEVGRKLLEFGQRTGVDVRVHPYFSDDQLWDYLAGLSVSVLPYRFGTHSGWLEACHDLGTAVIAPSCGFYREQRQCHEFVFDEDQFDPESLRRAVLAAYESVAQRPTWEQRWRERQRIADAHRDIYRSVLS